MTISKNESTKLILEKFPEFFSSLQAYKEEWDPWGETSYFGEVMVFSSFVSDLLVAKEYDSSKIEEIFSFMEYLLVQGDEDVSTAVATGFLENIINQTPEKIDPKRFVKYLGPESQAYCRAWDKFTGVQTEGLWKNSGETKLPAASIASSKLLD